MECASVSPPHIRSRAGAQASVAADGAVTGGALLPDTLASPILREYPPERALVLRERVLARDDRIARVRLSVAPMRPDASVGRGQVIATVTSQEAPRLVVDEDGRALLAWIEVLPRRRGQRSGTFRLRVSERLPGERFGAPRTLEQAADGGSLTTLAAGIQSARAVIAYSRTRVGAHGRLVSHTVETRTRDATRGWSRPQVLTRTGTASDISIAVGLGGRAYVVWRTQQGGIGNMGSWWIRAAVLHGAPVAFARRASSIAAVRRRSHRAASSSACRRPVRPPRRGRRSIRCP